jgi:hypothetical protein
MTARSNIERFRNYPATPTANRHHEIKTIP